ncbi:MAG: DUF1320 domain-containing protein [Nitrospinota bacterium]|nr:DUF1320 domain-containing protein [Nitrospinota bacterium]
MAYSTEADLKERVDEALLIQLTDRSGSGVVDTALVSAAIEDADALINGFISPVYQVPLSPVPRIVKEYSASIAIYKLHLYRSVEGPAWKDAYKMAISFFSLVGERKVALEGVVDKPSPSGVLASSVGYTAEERKFSRTKLSEW